MNKRVLNRIRQIEANISIVAEELGFDRKAAYRYAFEQGLACACVDAHTRAHTDTRTRAAVRECVPTRVRESASARVLNPDSILNTKEIDMSGGIAEGPSSKASINLFLDLDYVLGVTRKEMSLIPDWYVKWWHATQTANGWMTNQGKAITNYTWRPLLMTWWRNTDEKERGRIENEMKAAKSAAESKRVLSAADWAVCAEAGCLYFNDEKCCCSSGKTPCERAKDCPSFTKGIT